MVASWACDVAEILPQSDLTSPTSNHIPDIHIAVSVAHGTFYKFFFTRVHIV